MTVFTRRTFALGALAGTTTLAAGCSNGIGSSGPAAIDARVDATLDEMYDRYPKTIPIAEKSSGILVMPVVTEAGFGFGGGYGRGALRVGEATVDYYSAASAGFGLQIGAQQYTHVLFFMTDQSLEDFRRSTGYAIGADIEYAFSDIGETLKAETTTTMSPVVAVVFGQAGLKIGATLEGTKYTRIIP